MLHVGERIVHILCWAMDNRTRQTHCCRQRGEVCRLAVSSLDEDYQTYGLWYVAAANCWLFGVLDVFTYCMTAFSVFEVITPTPLKLLLHPNKLIVRGKGLVDR